MLQEIRKRSGSIVIKGILSLIGASFVVGGMIGVFHMMSELPPVAKVGRSKIFFQDFYEAYRRALAHARRKNSVLSKDQTENILPQKILDELIMQQVLRLEPNRRGFVVPDQMIIDQVHALCTVDGKYDPERLKQFLGMMRMTPAQLMEQIRQNLKLQQLLAPVSMGMYLNTPYVDLLVDTLGHQKNFEIVLIPWERVPDPQPKDDDLKEWLAKSKERYEVPDQRSVEVVVLDHKALGQRLPISEAEIRQEYEARQAEWTTPAEREVYKIEFNSEADAKDAKKIFQGKKISAKDVAKALPKVKLTPVEVRDLPKEDAEMVLGLGKGEAFGPSHQGEKWVVYCVLGFVPEKVKSLDDVKTEVEQGLRLQKVRAEIDSIKDKIEDALAGGKTVQEISEEYPLKAIFVSGITKEEAKEKVGHAFKKQNENMEVPEAAIDFVTNQAFCLEKGEESAFEDISDQSMIVRMIGLTPRHLPEMKEIKDRVQADWIQYRRRQSANELAFTLFGKANTIEEWNKAQRKSGLKVRHVTTSRLDCENGTSDLNKMFSGSVVNQLLLSASNSVNFVMTTNKQVAAVFSRTPRRDIVSTLDSKKTEQKTKVRQILGQNMSEEMTQLLVDSIQATYKVKINQKSVDRVIKGNNNANEEA